MIYFGAAAVGFMMLCYALEGRAAIYTLLFALGCFASSAYGWLAGTWPFGVVEIIWGFIALKKLASEVDGGALARRCARKQF